MAQTYLPARRGALYVLTQASDNVYLAPTQASDKALAVMDFTIAWEGGVVRVEDDLTPYGGGSLPYLGDTAISFKMKLRVPAWPGSRNAADLPAWAALLAMMPMAGDYSGNDAEFTPTSLITIGTAGTIKPASLTFLETGGDVWSMRDCVAIIDQITDDNGALVMEVSGIGLLRSLADTVKTLASASLTIADVAYTTATPIPARGATLTVTGLTGTGTYALRPGWSWNPGHKLDAQPDRASTFGYAVAAAASPGNAVFSGKVTKLDEAGAEWADAYLQQPTLTEVSLAWGSSGTAFRVALGSVVRVAEYALGEDAGVRAIDLGLVSSPSAGNDQYLLRWGTP